MLLNDHRFRHTHPHQFQEAQRAAAAADDARGWARAQSKRVDDREAAGESTTGSKKRRAVSPPPSVWPFCPAGRRRTRYSARHFESRFASKERIQSWYSRFPVLAQRNFYVLQEHAATALHWDLRLQLDGGLVSFCIPKGLGDFKKGDGESGTRAVIETPIHAINDCLLEGGSVGCKKVDDLGWYRILPTMRKEKEREGLRQQGFNDDDTTDEDEDEQRFEDEKQEDLFAEAYYYASFKSMGSRWGMPAPPSPKKDGSGHRGFVVELNGVRFKGLRLLLHRSNDDFKYQHTKSTSASTHLAKRVTNVVDGITRLSLVKKRRGQDVRRPFTPHQSYDGAGPPGGARCGVLSGGSCRVALAGRWLRQSLSHNCSASIKKFCTLYY